MTNSHAYFMIHARFTYSLCACFINKTQILYPHSPAQRTNTWCKEARRGI